MTARPKRLEPNGPARAMLFSRKEVAPKVATRCVALPAATSGEVRAIDYSTMSKAGRVKMGGSRTRGTAIYRGQVELVAFALTPATLVGHGPHSHPRGCTVAPLFAGRKLTECRWLR